MKTDTHDANDAKRIVASMSDDERERLSALIQQRDDHLRAAAAGLQEVIAIKDRVISEVRGRIAAQNARLRALCGEPKRTRKRSKPTVSGVVKQVTKAGVAVARVEVDPTSGKISVVTGKPTTTPDDNNSNNNNSDEWDSVLQ